MLGNNTVDKVVKKLAKVVTDLENVSAANRNKAKDKHTLIDELTTEALSMEAEANRADRIHGKFADLLEM